jgi:hypothetical protein
VVPTWCQNFRDRHAADGFDTTSSPRSTRRGEVKGAYRGGTRRTGPGRERSWSEVPWSLRKEVDLATRVGALPRLGYEDTFGGYGQAQQHWRHDDALR